MASTLAGLAARLTSAVKVGAFAVVTVGAGLFIYRYVTKSGDGDGGYVVFTRMKDASGIAKMSQVRIAGIPVGRVKSIKLEHDIARIDISMNKDVPLYDDAAAAKVTSSLLGEFQLKLAPGTKDRRKLADNKDFADGERLQVVRALSRVATPTAETVDKLKELQDHPLLGPQAKYGLGSNAYRLQGSEPELASRLVAELGSMG